MCKCVSNINEKLAEKNQILPMAFSIDLKNNDPTARMNLELVIPLTRKNGSAERRNTVPRYAVASYCPFCGEKAA